MELIRISERKLKIMLTPTDMCHFELNDDSFERDSEKMHRAFRLLLDEVRRQTDFSGDERHLSIQYFPSREGGCEMFISQLCHDGETEKITDGIEFSGIYGGVEVFHLEGIFYFNRRRRVEDNQTGRVDNPDIGR